VKGFPLPVLFLSPRRPKKMAPRCLYSIGTTALTTAARYRGQAAVPRLQASAPCVAVRPRQRNPERSIPMT
jgi:hypothetical protein